MKITSTAFENNGNLPSKYTCDGEGINPPLSFSEVPEAAQSLVLISDDPDAPSGTFVHWTIWNIDPKSTGIAENSIPAGTTQGINSYGKEGYGVPCPPTGVHRYYFKLYALDTKLYLPSVRADSLEKAMIGHTLDKAELIGLYTRNK
jgi:hypothetical protein